MPMEAVVEERPVVGQSDAALEADVDRIVGLYRYVGRALRANDPANWAEGLTMPQIRILFHLGRSGPLSVGQVACGIGISQPSATETLDKLVRHGLVERTADPADRRVVRNTLTERGREMIDRPWETRRAVLASALRTASREERAAIEQGMALLRGALERVEGTLEGSADSAGGAGSVGEKAGERGVERESRA